MKYSIPIATFVSWWMLVNGVKADDFPMAKGLPIEYPQAHSNLVEPKPKVEVKEIKWLDEDSYDSAYKQMTDSDKPILILFTDPISCIPCKQLEATTLKETEVINKLNNDFITLKVRVNTTKGSSLANNFNVRSWPFMLIYKSGKFVDRHSGVLSKSDMLSFLECKPKSNITTNNVTVVPLTQSTGNFGFFTDRCIGRK